MAITLYYGSGSPYAWRVQLALEHKGLDYERKMLSFADKDTRKPEFVAINPRHRVPTITDGDFALYESNAIVEYLDEAYPAQGRRLFPGDARNRALVRRLICEMDNYTSEATDAVITYAFYTKPEAREPAKLAEGKQGVRDEYAMYSKAMRGDFLAGDLSAADFTLYPLVAFMKRCEVKLPDLDSDGMLTPEMRAWKARMEALPYLDKTIPPHWRT
ncbi:MAG: glutathione S-transferase family protein [Casimicrobiaceae bacterium]|jgi:glutathione S-transferase